MPTAPFLKVFCKNKKALKETFSFLQGQMIICGATLIADFYRPLIGLPIQPYPLTREYRRRILRAKALFLWPSAVHHGRLAFRSGSQLPRLSVRAQSICLPHQRFIVLKHKLKPMSIENFF